MIRIFLFITTFLLSIGSSKAQQISQLVSYEKNPNVYPGLYKNDSTIFSSYGEDNQLFNGKKWKILDLKDGLIYTSPNSKIYFLDMTSFSIINPFTFKKEKSYPFSRKYFPNYFEVFNDSFFIAYNSNYDTAVYKVDFDEKKIKKQSLLLKAKQNFRGATLVDDSILYLATNGSLYKKNLYSGNLSKLLIYFSYAYFDCHKNNIAIADDANHVYISKNYGQSFTEVNLSKYNGIQTHTFHITDSVLNFIKFPNYLVTTDFQGKQIASVNVNEISTKLTAYYSTYPCDHDITAFGRLIWLNDSTWLLPSGDGDLYKVNPFKNRVKYLGGTYNMGVNTFTIERNESHVFIETSNGLWSASSDTGKTMMIPEMSMKEPSKRIEIIGSQVYILNKGKLYLYRYSDNTIDTSFQSFSFFINDFSIKDSLSVFLHTVSGTYILNINNRVLTLIGPASPFENFLYLKKSKRFLSLTDVGIFHNDDLGINWKKSTLIGFTDFLSLGFQDFFRVKEVSKDQIFINVNFNGLPAILESHDGGKNFFVRQDSIMMNAISNIELYGDVYSLENVNTITKSDANSRTSNIDMYNSECKALGMAAVDSGFVIWNSRAEVFHRKLPYKRTFPLNSQILIFPNPVEYNSELNLVLPLEITSKIKKIEFYDMLGKNQNQVLISNTVEQNSYKISNLPREKPQLYLMRIQMEDEKYYWQKVLIY